MLSRTLLALLALMTVSACARAASDTPIDAARIEEAVKTLGSDEFGGRGPGTPGEDRTVEYLVSTFKQIGLEPGGENGGWTQRVDLRSEEHTSELQSLMRISYAVFCLIKKKYKSSSTKI